MLRVSFVAQAPSTTIVVPLPEGGLGNICLGMKNEPMMLRVSFVGAIQGYSPSPENDGIFAPRQRTDETIYLLVGRCLGTAVMIGIHRTNGGRQAPALRG